jgi:predicted small secreted protein
MSLRPLSGIVLFLATCALLTACNRNESGGPAEKAGREIDRGINQAGKAVEQAGRDMQDAAKGKK